MNYFVETFSADFSSFHQLRSEDDHRAAQGQECRKDVGRLTTTTTTPMKTTTTSRSKKKKKLQQQRKQKQKWQLFRERIS